ncbi:hypothetical protein ACRVLY_002879 [Listeria monocytogenes]|uniref:hypothetical protein n=1 Tax=Listeria monocytogenes TaxID=1639 RepID=UPI00087565D3|nr:hypothetical protein [Listeria monocytogenes]EAC7182550.1 hypothetical protein [Listeria monocytogenes]EAC8000838.1 hypothetical protein [Listeria monocytogenes]EAC8350996.1 hypothetical protein [Listeria monocytogenes]EAC9519219.1 hypothetical protein [Listeria monocytogenes]EAD0740561.1 hypothetical protein [Listeria monocytogenes]
MANDEKLSPIISRKRKSTLNSKKVDIAGVGDFGRETTPAPSVNNQTYSPSKDNPLPVASQSIIPEENTKVLQQAVTNEVDLRRKATKTQKMSPDVILKLNTLKPYIKDLEEMGSDGNPSINDIVNMLLDNYINTKLSTRQLQGYKAVYQNLFEHL